MQKKTLLIIHNSQVFIDMTKKILERSGYLVRTATGVAAAREQLIDVSPDGIVLGIDLPDGQALNFCDELRIKTTAPVMFVSNSKEDELPALKAGASDFLKMPFDYEIFKARLSVMLDMKVNYSQIPEDDDESNKSDFAEEPADSMLRLYPNDASEISDEKKSRKASEIRFMVFTVAACLILAMIGFGLNFLVNGDYGNGSYIDLEDPRVPLAEDEYTPNPDPYDDILNGDECNGEENDEENDE